MATLALVRHGESAWNKIGKWTGLTDISLSEKGREEAKQAARLLKDYSFDQAYTSVLKRAIETLIIITRTLHLLIPVIETEAMNERDYGEYTGKKKWEIKMEVGDETFQKIRRSWDYPIPHGESLKQVSDRTVPYFQTHILPQLKDGKSILVVAHGNSLRTIMKHLEHISDVDIAHIEIATGQVVAYEINEQGSIINKKILPEKQNTA